MTHKHSIITLLSLVTALTLSSTPEIDRRIEADAKASYNFHVVLDDKVLASSEHGIVTLTGTVHDENGSEIAQATVENIPEVRGVINIIVVSATIKAYSDKWMELRIRELLLMKSNTLAKDTEVVVNEGVVTLNGVATNLAQKELTAIYVKELEWVKSVNNFIVVTNRHNSSGMTTEEQIDDASISSQLHYLILHQKATCTLNPTIVTHKGVITITGDVASSTEKSFVSKLANELMGVQSVKNNMTIIH